MSTKSLLESWYIISHRSIELFYCVSSQVYVEKYRKENSIVLVKAVGKVDSMKSKGITVIRILLRIKKFVDLYSSIILVNVLLIVILVLIVSLPKQRSFACVTILAITTLVMFILIMDILKYCFSIDPVHKEREELQRKKKTTSYSTVCLCQCSRCN